MAMAQPSPGTLDAGDEWGVRELRFYRLGMAVLVTMLVVVLAFYAFWIAFGGLVQAHLGIALGDVEGQVGFEWLLVPFVAIAGVLLHRRFAWLVRLKESREAGPYFPLVTAVVLGGIVLLLVFAGGRPAPPLVLALQWGGVVLALGAVFVGINLYPRGFAIVAGSQVGVLLFVVVALIGQSVSADFERFLQEPTSHGVAWMFLACLLGGGALAGASFWFWVREPSWTPSASHPPRSVVLAASSSAAVALAFTPLGFYTAYLIAGAFERM